MAMRVLYVKMDKLVEKKLFERLLPRAASLVAIIAGSKAAATIAKAIAGCLLTGVILGWWWLY